MAAPPTGCHRPFQLLAVAAVHARHVEDGVAVVALADHQLPPGGGLEEPARVEVVDNRQQALRSVVAHRGQPFLRIMPLPGGSGVDVTRQTSASCDLRRRRAAHLAHALEHVVQSVDVALREMPAAGVDRDRATDVDRAARHERAAFALGAEPPVLDLEQHGDAEAVVELGHIDVGRAEAGAAVQHVGHRRRGQRRDRRPGQHRIHHPRLRTRRRGLRHGADEHRGLRRDPWLARRE